MHRDKLTWSAVFEDGTTFSQFQDDVVKSSEHISREKLRAFCLQTKSGKVIFVRELLPGWRFFYRRRTAMVQGGKSSVVHIVGWQIPIGDEYLTQMAFVYEEDLSIIIGDTVVGTPQPILGKLFCWRYPVEYVAADSAVIT